MWKKVYPEDVVLCVELNISCIIIRVSVNERLQNSIVYTEVIRQEEQCEMTHTLTRCTAVFRPEVASGAAAPPFLPFGFVGLMVPPDRQSVLADTTPEALAYCQSGLLTAHPLWTPATQG